jgi:hypothetical protein
MATPGGVFNRGECRGACSGLFPLSFASRLLFTKLSPPPLFARFLVILMSPQFFLHPASLDQFLESLQRLSDRLFVVYTHPKAHSSSYVRNFG